MQRRGHMGRTDSNQKEIVKRLRQLGMSVAITSSVGAGFGDILVGFRGKNFLCEIKEPGKAKQLTPAEEKFHAEWKGHLITVTSHEEIEAEVQRLTLRGDL